MNAQMTIPRPARRWPLAAAAAVLAVCITAAVFAHGGGTQQTASSLPVATPPVASPTHQGGPAMDTIMALTPARLAAGALGTGYALPSAPSGRTTASVLAAMSPQTRAYTKAIMSLTFAQLAAGAGGHP
jgi:hypothetical protein